MHDLDFVPARLEYERLSDAASFAASRRFLEQLSGFAADGSQVKHYDVRESVGIAVGFLLAALQREAARLRWKR